MNELSTIEIAWLAGWLEGEGCFYNEKNGAPCVSVSTTDKDTAEKAVRFMLAKKSYGRIQREGCKKQWDIRVNCKKAMRVMCLILPFMGSRRSEKIKEVIHIASLRPGKARGSRNKKSILTEDAVRDIKMKLGSGCSRSSLARIYGVRYRVIYDISVGKTWSHVTF